jgi:DNA-binding XRE family transcriptional regulator
MSTDMHGVGLRMLSVRKEHGITQAVAAAQLNISTKTYIFYEQEKREIPTSTAVKFCDLFNVDIGWLLLGEATELSAELWDQIERSIRVVLDWNSYETKNYSNEKLAALARLIATQSRASSQPPEQVSEAILKVM